MKECVLDIRPAILTALERKLPLVALESTLIAHGLPWPLNLETALAAEAAVRDAGAVPATIAILGGVPTIGLEPSELEHLARSNVIRKASSRDLAAACAQHADAATTVAGTMRLAARAGILIFATGGIGGVHPLSEADRQTGARYDISADLLELAWTPVTVVCAGAKSILDLPATLEVLETHAVPVLGYQTDTFPAFYLHSSGLPVSSRVETPAEAAAIIACHRQLGGKGVVLAKPLDVESALAEEEYAPILQQALAEARSAQIHGPALTPFLLGKLATLTGGKTLRANQQLIVENARLAALVAGG